MSLIDAACASRGELQMHHIPFFFKVRSMHMRMPMRMHMRMRMHMHTLHAHLT